MVRSTLPSGTSGEVAAALQAFVRADSKKERNSAIADLVKIGSPTIVPLVSLRNSSCYWGVNKDVYEVARQIGKPAIPELISVLKTLNAPDDPEGKQQQVVFGATDVLGQIGESVIPQLTPLLRDPNVRIRLNTIQALEAIGKPAIPQLVSVVKADSNLQVRSAATKALKELGYKPPKA